MKPIKIPSGIAASLTYDCPNCGNPIVFDYEVDGKGIVWTMNKGELIEFHSSTCGICISAYVLPIEIKTEVDISINGYMKKKENN